MTGYKTKDNDDVITNIESDTVADTCSIGESLIGQLLIATPGMTDPAFKQAVILICGQDEHGAMGIVLNKLFESLTLSEVIGQLSLDVDLVGLDMPVHYGGPVEMGRGFALHAPEYFHKDSIMVSDAFALTANVEILKVMALDTQPQLTLLALGYAGWGAGQLEEELKENAWVHVHADHELVFKTPTNKMWTKALNKLGVKPEMLSMTVGNA